MSDLIKRSDAVEVVQKRLDSPYMQNAWQQGACLSILRAIEELPSADRPKHYCAECKFEPIDKRCVPCSSCTNNPKNRDAFVSCEAELKGADDEA